MEVSRSEFLRRRPVSGTRDSTALQEQGHPRKGWHWRARGDSPPWCKTSSMAILSTASRPPVASDSLAINYESMPLCSVRFGTQEAFRTEVRRSARTST